MAAAGTKQYISHLAVSSSSLGGGNPAVLLVSRRIWQAGALSGGSQLSFVVHRITQAALKQGKTLAP